MAEKFEINQLIEIFDADTEFITQIGTLTLLNKEGLAELLIDNNSDIAESTARELSDAGYLAGSIGSFAPNETADLLQIYYTFKYSAIKLFFRENYHKYIPEYDLHQIKQNLDLTMSDKSKDQLLTEAFMREFDRFSFIIDNVVYTQDLNKVPQEYLNYLAQIIGYQRDDYLLLSNSTFRELLKNIIEIYRIKGSNYSFELFFNFLGFDITINEYWFDKRYGDPGIVTNQYTGSIDKKNYLFYLTPLKPTTIIPDDMIDPFSVNEYEITEPRNILMFLQYTGWVVSGDTRGFTYQQLIGDTTGYTGDTFTYFKTNVMKYSLTSLGSEQEPELDSDELAKIEFYAKFLSPVYAERQISLAVAPYVTDISNEVNFQDTNRADPIYRVQTNTDRKYYVQSIDANVGDTRNPNNSSYDNRAIVVVSDSSKELYNWIHRKDRIYLTGDTTSGDINIGNYFVAGDSFIEKVINYDITEPSGWAYANADEEGDSYVIEGDSYIIYDEINSETWIILKGPLSSSSVGDSSTILIDQYGIGDTIGPYRGGDTYLGTDQTSAGGYLWIGGPDIMMHLHEGSYPTRYYWGYGDSYGDTYAIYMGDSSFIDFGDSIFFTCNLGDSFLSFGLFIGDSIIEEHKFISRMNVTILTGDTSGDSLGNYVVTQTIVKEIGDTYIYINTPVGSGDSYGYIFIDNRKFMGHYISGHHTDTHNVLYGDSINGDTNAISAYAVIKNANPTWPEEQVFIEINDKETDLTLYDYETTTFKVRPRELLVMVDAIRKQPPGDSIWSAGDSFIVGDTYLYRVGDSKERLYLQKVTGGYGDTPGDSYRSGDSYYRSSGDSIHGYVLASYVIIEGNKHLITEIGDSHIGVAPWYTGGYNSYVFKTPNWNTYINSNLGDTNNEGDSIYYTHAGFINPVLNNTIDFSETGVLSLGMNASMVPEDSGRPIEYQSVIDRNRETYWKVEYSAIGGDTDLFSSGEVIIGDSSGISLWVLGKGGDSTFFTLWKEGNLFIGESLTGQTSGDSGTFTSITTKTDQRGLITQITAITGVIHVYDPGDSGDSFISEWANLTKDDYIMIYEANNSVNNGEYRVWDSTRIVPGDTTVITLGDSIINGIDQIINGGYIDTVGKSKIQSIIAVNGNGVGEIIVYDTGRTFYGLTVGDTIIVKDTGDSNIGIYTVGDSVSHIRAGFGDSIGTTYFELGDSIDHDSGDSGGVIEIYSSSWLIGDSAHQNGFDYLDFTKMR